MYTQMRETRGRGKLKIAYLNRPKPPNSSIKILLQGKSSVKNTMKDENVR